MPTMFPRILVSMISGMTLIGIVHGEDLHFTRNVSVAGNSVSTSEVWVKGARERSATRSPMANIVTLRQCDLKRTLTINDQTKSYLVLSDPQDDSTAQAAAMFGGAPEPPPSSGGTITETVSLIDTGERKLISGYTARRLKTTVIVEPSANACSQTKQQFEIDGWYADIKEQASCGVSLPPIRQQQACADRVVLHRKGTAKPGFPLLETVTVKNNDASTTKVEINTLGVTKDTLAANLFDTPANYREVQSAAELYAVSQTALANSFPPATQPTANAATSGPGGNNALLATAQQMAALQQSMAPASPFQNAMPGMQTSASNATVPLPQALGPKALGKIRIGIAPADTQVGQGNNAQADYATPIRNAIVYMMNGPAIEIAALDSRVPMQIQAEAQQKQCDYILLSSVTVKHASSSFGKFVKMSSIAATVTPMGMMTKSMSGAIASQAAAQAAAMTAQQQAMNQLTHFNGQIKSKDDVTVNYQLFPTGANQPKLENSLKGRAKADGEDVLTPLIQQAATSILTEVVKK